VLRWRRRLRAAAEVTALISRVFLSVKFCSFSEEKEPKRFFTMASAARAPSKVGQPPLNKSLFASFSSEKEESSLLP
jgi:hypothetical protein